MIGKPMGHDIVKKLLTSRREVRKENGGGIKKGVGAQNQKGHSFKREA